jgi:uncharacterized integral membrane protein
VCLLLLLLLLLLLSQHYTEVQFTLAQQKVKTKASETVEKATLP